MADEDQSEGASSLREKLADRSNLATDALARAVIAEEGLEFIEVSDFRGMDPEKVEESARALNAEREGAANKALETLLKSKGIDSLEELQGGGGAGSDTRAAVERTRQATGVPASGKVDDISHLDPLDGSAQMREHFKRQA